MEINELIVEKIKNFSPNAIEETSDFRSDFSLVIKKDELLKVAEFLKADPDLLFVQCKDVTAIDWAKRKNRFTTVYHIYSFKLNKILRLKVNLGEEPQVDSVVSVWQSANWYERETWDMYGIKFLNHPDLRRMYMPEQFEYHPLRKDFPVMGIPGSIPLPSGPQKD